MKSAEGRTPSALNRAYSSVPEIVRHARLSSGIPHARPLLVPALGPRLTLAPYEGPVPRAGQRGDAPADAGLARPPGLPALPRALSDAPRPFPRAARRRTSRVVGPRVQPACAGPASNCAHTYFAVAAHGRLPRRAPGHRRVHGLRRGMFRVR